MNLPSPLEYGPPSDDQETRAVSEIMMLALFPTHGEGEGWFDRWIVRASAMGDFRVVRSGGHTAGGLLILPMGQWFGGKAVSSAAITVVAVAPEHRGHGAALHLMRETIHELAAQGTALSVLYPATHSVYRRAGYACAGTRFTYTIPTALLPSHHTGAMVRPATDFDHNTLRSLYTDHARLSPGSFDRSEAYWTHRVVFSSLHKLHTYVVEFEGVAEGYVVYLQKDGAHRYELHVHDYCAATPRACMAIASFLAGHRSMATTTVFHGGLNEALLGVLPEQPASGPVTRRFDWMLRIADLRTALTARGYPQAVKADLHLDVVDNVVPQNNGRVVLSVQDGAGHIAAGGHGGLRLDVGALAAMYTGWRSAEDLVHTGEASVANADGARTVAEANTVFAGPTPAMPDFF